MSKHKGKRLGWVICISASYPKLITGAMYEAYEWISNPINGVDRNHVFIVNPECPNIDFGWSWTRFRWASPEEQKRYEAIHPAKPIEPEVKKPDLPPECWITRSPGIDYSSITAAVVGKAKGS